jgi:hypothetical protein
MIDFCKSVWVNDRFSVIAFFVTAILGLFSMGLLGGLLYYPVSFLFRRYPSLNEWHGDWVWPAIIAVGMFWSLGFVFGGIATHYIGKLTESKFILYGAYLFILWGWAALLWYLVIKSNM